MTGARFLKVRIMFDFTHETIDDLESMLRNAKDLLRQSPTFYNEREAVERLKALKAELTKRDVALWDAMAAVNYID